MSVRSVDDQLRDSDMVKIPATWSNKLTWCNVISFENIWSWIKVIVYFSMFYSSVKQWVVCKRNGGNVVLWISVGCVIGVSSLWSRWHNQIISGVARAMLCVRPLWMSEPLWFAFSCSIRLMYCSSTVSWSWFLVSHIISPIWVVVWVNVKEILLWWVNHNGSCLVCSRAVVW